MFEIAPVRKLKQPPKRTETQKSANVILAHQVVLHNVSSGLGPHSQLVAVHVRRGDYVNSNKKELHGALSVEYYNEAYVLCSQQANC